MPENNLKIDIVKIVFDIFKDGIEQGASDVHFEPNRDGVVIRYRIDGNMKIISQGDKELYSFILARIKIMSNIETTGLPRPQEGNIKFEYDDEFVDLRISIFPTSMGECVVARILESNKFFQDYKQLGFSQEQVDIITDTTKRPYGLVLVTGPNGSGKSTTLFTMLNNLNVPERTLVTLEDPVERKINMVRQTNINPKIGLTFADGLRYLLRQDPNIIMVGEIRDKETALIAVEAAITGHLVVATIHTNNAAGAVVRLLNMGIEPYLLSSALRFASAQRLAHLNCPHCKEEYAPSTEFLKKLGAPSSIKFHHSKGCDQCGDKGHKGRQGIHEILVVNKAIQDIILERPTDDQINKVAREAGMVSLRQSALEQVYEGRISVEEALRLTE